jgi:hypothetical protein
VGRTDYWYLEQSQQPTEPKSRAEVEDLDVWVEPEPEPEPEKPLIDEKLPEAVRHAAMALLPAAASAAGHHPSFEALSEILAQGGSARIQPTCALHYAVAGARLSAASAERACDVLLRANADINHADPSGCTPLHVLAQLGFLTSPPAIQFLSFLLERGADPLALTYDDETPLDYHIRSTTSQIQSSLDFQASFGHGSPQLETQAESHLAVSILLRRAEAARRKQLDEREVLVKSLMYFPGFYPDILRKIHAAVAPPPMADYPPLGRDLPDDTHVVLGVLEERQLSGLLGVIAGWDPVTLRYEVSLRDDEVGPEIIVVAPDKVLPLSREISVPH